MKILVIGEAPSRWMDERGIVDPLPLAGKELAALARVSWPEQWFELFEPINVLDKWPGHAVAGKGDAWPLDQAMVRVANVILPMCVDRRVILLGRRVEKAFQFREAPWFGWRSTGFGFEAATAPHPSHVNRWWNLESNRRDAATFWQAAARNGAACA